MSERAVASSALSNLGADLSVSISFSVANEFIGAAREAQMGDDELVAVLVTVVVVVTSVKRLVDRASRWLASSSASKKDDGDAAAAAAAAVTAATAATATAAAATAATAATAASSSSSEEEEQRGLLEFISLILSIVQRITLSISVQVLAYSVKTNQPSRLVRVTTLLGVVVFFVFFESAATRKY